MATGQQVRFLKFGCGSYTPTYSDIYRQRFQLNYCRRPAREILSIVPKPAFVQPSSRMRISSLNTTASIQLAACLARFSGALALHCILQQNRCRSMPDLNDLSVSPVVFTVYILPATPYRRSFPVLLQLQSVNVEIPIFQALVSSVGLHGMRSQTRTLLPRPRVCCCCCSCASARAPWR